MKKTLILNLLNFKKKIKMKKIYLFLSLILSTNIVNAQLNNSTQVTILDIQTNDMVYDSITDRLYLSIKSTNGVNGNSIGVFNTQNNTLENTVFVGSEPGVLAISDDGQYIYTGLQGSPTVNQFIVGTQQVGIQFNLGSDNFSGPYFAYDIAVMPGNPEAVAVSRNVQGSSGFYGTAIFDSGIERTINTSSVFPYNDSYVIEFYNDSVMFGYNNHSTGYDLNTLKVDSVGVYEVSNIGNLVQGFNINNMEVVGDRIFFGYGAVVNITDVNNPLLQGTFFEVYGPVTYDDNYNLVCFVSKEYWDDDVYFKRYNPDNYILVDSIKINGLEGGDILSVEHCGDGKYAFNTSEGKLVIINAGDPNYVSIEENLEPSSIQINQNPVTNILSYTLLDNIKLTELDIYNLEGQLVENIELNDGLKVSINILTKGAYLLRFNTNEGESIVKRIVKE